ncbi:MAG: hypothetical protein LKE53_03150 [Oscillospiraceae bacterium]|nr:hypothetical protein [Oscillospiraceae bacterium]
MKRSGYATGKEEQAEEIQKQGEPITKTPDNDIEALARVLLPEVQKFYESKDGKRLFADWKAKMDNEN